MKKPKYSELAEEIRAMHVGDCLRWTQLPALPTDRQKRTFLVSAGNYAKRAGISVRQFLHESSAGLVFYVIRVE